MVNTAILKFTTVNDELQIYLNGNRLPWQSPQPAEERFEANHYKEYLAGLKERATLGLMLPAFPEAYRGDWEQDMTKLSGWRNSGTNTVVLRCTDTAGWAGEVRGNLTVDGVEKKNWGEAIGSRVTISTVWMIDIAENGDTTSRSGVAAKGGGQGKPFPTGGATHGTETFSAVVGDDKTVAEVMVWMNMTHTYVHDLRIKLESPGGTAVTLYNQNAPAEHHADGAAFKNALFSNRTLTTISGNPPYSGMIRPVGDLADFIGESAKGTWKLVVEDVQEHDLGTMGDWRLDILTQD